MSVAETHRSTEAAARLVRWWRGLGAGTKDAAGAVLLSLVTQVELLTVDVVEGSALAQSLAFAVITLSPAWRRTRPLLAAVLLGVGAGVQTLLGTAEVVGGFVAMLVVTYSVAAHAERTRDAIAGGLAVLAGVSVYPFVNETSLADEIGNVAIFASLWGLGRLVRTWRQGAAEAEARALAAQQAQDEQVRQALAAERSRIARELHDVVAHGVSGMVLQAGAARQVLDRDPDAAREPLLAVEQLGRDALDEMRRLLGLLRRNDDPETMAPPRPLAAIEELLDDARAAGLDATLRVEGEERALPSGLQASAYRIVQEALSNTLKHAAASRVDVVLRYDDDGIEVAVTDDGAGANGSGPGTGHGLLGMRERAELFGGTLAAGPHEPSGWVVRARLATEG